MLNIALKEWAVVCEALASGQQTILLRKGGIAEPRGEFHVEHSRFWLYPTNYHFDVQAIRSSGLPMIERAKRHQPPPGQLRLCVYAEVQSVHLLTSENQVMVFCPYQILSAETLLQRFRYRSPGLNLMLVRIFQVACPIFLREEMSYAGCKSWVSLETSMNTEPSQAVLTDEQFADMRQHLQQHLVSLGVSAIKE